MKKKPKRESLINYIGSLDVGDSFSDLHLKKEVLFLRKFSADDLYDIMKKVGFIEHLAKFGLADIKVTIEIDDSMVHYMKVYFERINPDNLLLDLRLSESKFVPPARFFKNPNEVVTYDMIIIEWLSTQNPFGKFSDNRPQLPGQKRPGLGALKFCFDMMYIVAKEIVKDGFLDVPDHAHGAIMYSKKFKFFDPRHEGVLRAILRDMKKFSLLDVSWGLITNTIIDTYKNSPHVYDPSEQIFYVSSRMRNYFHSSAYKSVFQKYYRNKKFRFDFEEMVKRRDKILKSKSIEEL